jgi:hypothetical protein
LSVQCTAIWSPAYTCRVDCPYDVVHFLYIWDIGQFYYVLCHQLLFLLVRICTVAAQLYRKQLQEDIFDLTVQLVYFGLDLVHLIVLVLKYLLAGNPKLAEFKVAYLRV